MAKKCSGDGRHTNFYSYSKGGTSKSKRKPTTSARKKTSVKSSGYGKKSKLSF